MPEGDGIGKPQPGPGAFTTTRWSIVLAAGNRASPARREALSTLCSVYWYPLYAFARRNGNDPEEAQDQTQEFFARLLEKETLRHADPDKGRFRSFLLASFKNFMTDERRRAHAKKRGGGQTPIPIDVETAEGKYSLEPSHDQTPEKIFERRWALTLLDRVVERLREEHSNPRKERLFDKLKVYLPGEASPIPYARMAADLDMGEVTLKVAVHRLRRRFGALLLEEIGQTVNNPEEVEAELQHLYSALEG